MEIRRLHDWGLPPSEAVALQKALREQVITCPLPAEPRLVAGGDISYSRRFNLMFAVVLVLEFPGMEIVEESRVIQEVTYPYVPGLLSFREAPALLEACARLKRWPDVLLVDGQGQAHPRGVGIATHLGLWLDLPTIGCAKSLLCGHAEEPGPEPGAHMPLIYRGNTIGALLRTRRNVKPLIVSPGHKADLPGSLALVMRCLRGYRLPEPTRHGHRIVTRMRVEYEATR